ncbi:hypothetical protein FEK30_15665 [Picosynechococcus sp. PCC 11901]|uniref:hypothetical protein n=1 Tax=Picosynechococcus sp. PCC 11901 TaxID=2579791 RepID=UPI0010FC25C4|nr:hypothetical protein [Picosynechococcus sp. PCC 11901]QCS50744.1 hypothetical protein FEK30_15665 [Picosynechococcus sp. PCC 11901]
MIANPSSSPSFDNVTPLPQSGASVPISVYQQLAEKLRATQAEMTALQQENQQLRVHNRKLYNQVHQVVQSTECLKEMVNRHDFGIEPLPPVTPHHRPPQEKPTVNNVVAALPTPEPVRQFTTVLPEHFESGTDFDAGVSAWVLLVAAIAMILTAFGAGYMVVLPLLNNNNAPSR